MDEIQHLPLIILETRVIGQRSLRTLLFHLVVFLNQVLGALLEIKIVVLDQCFLVKIRAQSVRNNGTVVLLSNVKEAVVGAQWHQER